jgi:hypothetical protein
VSPVLATNRAGNFVRALITIMLLALLFREAYLMWFFHTPAWTSRPEEIRYCGTWYEQQDGRDVTSAEARVLAGGRLKEVMRSPVFRPVAAYRPAKACPRHIFAKISKDGFVTYLITED